MNNISLEAARVVAASFADFHSQSKIYYLKVPSSLAVGSPQVLQGHHQSKESCMCGRRQMRHLLKGKLVAKPKLQAFHFSCWKGSHAPALHVVLQVLESQMENNFLKFCQHEGS